MKLASIIRKNSFVLSKIEKLTNALTMFDLPIVTSTLEEIKSLSIDKRRLDSESLRKQAFDIKNVLVNGVTSKSKKSVVLDDLYQKKSKI